MIEKNANRLVILPLMLLALFLGLFALVEYRKIAMDGDIKEIINAPIPEYMMAFHNTVLSFDGTVDQYGDENGPPRVKNESLRKAFAPILQGGRTLSGLFLEEALSGRESLPQSDLLRRIVERIDRIAKRLPSEDEPLAPNDWEILRDEAHEELRDVNALAALVSETRKQNANEILKELAHYEKIRALLSLLVMFSGLALILSLMNNLCRFRQNAERATAAERYNALFAAALQSTRVGVLIRDMRKDKHPVVFINAAFTNLTGYTRENLENQDSEFLFGWRTEPEAIMAFRRAISLQETATFDLLVYRKDGSPFWSEWHMSPVHGPDGTLTHFVSLFTDTSALRQTQEDLIQAKEMAQNASAIKTNFLAMMSHEIRTPINGILGVLKLVEETPLDADQRHLIEIAKTSSNALHGIINDILDYAKMEAGKIEIYAEPFSLSELMLGIGGLFRPIVSDKAIEFQIDVLPDVPDRLMSDVGRIRQILLNLISNAIKFTEQGFVRVRLSSMMSQDVEGAPGILLRCDVQDSGIGISAEDQEKLFKEFSQVDRSFTRRFGGTGLGLAISRRLVSLLHGEIGIESQPGKGSKFWFMIPIQLAPQKTETEKTPLVAEPLPSLQEGRVYHVLLVEDNDTNRLVARRYLEKMGFLVEEAVDGIDAIEKAKAAEFDLILMDVSMPKMDGMLATCHIRSLGGKNVGVPIIALTAHAMAGDKELCLAAGMNDYLFKPLDFDALLHAIERWLHVRIDSAVQRPAGQKISPRAPVLAGNDKETDPFFDGQVLQRMKDDLGGQAVDQVTATFLKDSANRVLLFDQGDRETLRDAAHTLKSCSANCGLMQFSRLMAAIEKAAAGNDRTRLAELTPLVKDAYSQARAKLEAERSKYIS